MVRIQAPELSPTACDFAIFLAPPPAGHREKEPREKQAAAFWSEG